MARCITADTKYEEYADRTIKAFSGQTSLQPQSYTQLMLATDFIVGPSYEIVIVGEAADEATRAMTHALNTRFMPNKVVILRPPGDEETAITKLAPYTAAQTAIDGKPTVYVCREFACLAPTTELEEMLESLPSLEPAQEDPED